jgi:allantoinase
MKTGDFWRAWGGIAGVQSTLSVLLERGYHGRGLPLEQIASLIAMQPARRFRISAKGSIAPGMDADLALVDLSRSRQLQPEHLMQRHRLSPYVGACFRCSIERTIRRGETIFAAGAITAQSRGMLVKPSANK